MEMSAIWLLLVSLKLIFAGRTGPIKNSYFTKIVTAPSYWKRTPPYLLVFQNFIVARGKSLEKIFVRFSENPIKNLKNLKKIPKISLGKTQKSLKPQNPKTPKPLLLYIY